MNAALTLFTTQQTQTTIEEQYSRLGRLSEAQQFAYLAELAERACQEQVLSGTGENLGAAASQHMPAPHGPPGYGTAFHKGNLIVATVAMRLEGDKAAAVKYLAPAATAAQQDGPNTSTSSC